MLAVAASLIGTPVSDIAPTGTSPAARRRFHGPFARWPRVSDAVLAATIFLLSVFVTDGPGDSLVLRSVTEVPVYVVLLMAVASAALYRRRHEPLMVLGVSLVAWIATFGSGYSDLGGVTIVATYSVGRYLAASRWALGEAGVAAAAAVVLADGYVNDLPWAEAVFGAVVFFVVWYIGRRLQLRAQRAAQLRRERAAEARRIVTEERARIARELHDVVAHRVSLMTVQAGAAKSVIGKDRDAALAAIAAVEEAGRQALSELRDLLGVLRPQPDSDDLGPQPGLADLPRLAEQFRGAGLDVSLPTDDVPDLPDRVDLFAYRIVQEALTNVLKHAGPGAYAEVRLNARANGIVIEVLDNGRSGGNATEGDSGGHGIVGMRERALLLGGTLDAGPRRTGGFRVAAYLPTGEETS